MTYKFFKTIFLITIFVFSCKKEVNKITTENITNASIQFEKTAPGIVTGSTIIKEIGTGGGSISIPSAGAKIVIPPDAMNTGDSISITPITDALDNEGEGLRISGLWKKPITVEFTTEEEDINIFRIYAKIPNDIWIGSHETNVSGDVVSVKLGENSGPTVKNGNTNVKKNYDLAFAKDFYLKPKSSILKVGESVQFTAYARAGKVPHKYTDKDGKTRTYIEDEDDVVPLAPSPKKYDDDEPYPLVNSPIDEDVVPLAPYHNIDSDDDVVPLAVRVKEYEFKNTKEGFNRIWTVLNPIGNITQEGKFTALIDNSIKGQQTTVKFISTNIKTSQMVEMTGVVYIKDDVQRYVGTIELTTRTDWYDVMNYNAEYEMYETENSSANVSFLYDPSRSDSKDAYYNVDINKNKTASLNTYSFYKYTKDFTNHTETKTENLNGVANDVNWTDINNSNAPLYIDLEENEYKISFTIKLIGVSKNWTHVTTGYANNTNDNGTTTADENVSIFTNKAGIDNIPITDINELKGERTWTTKVIDPNNGKTSAQTTYTAKWSFKLQ